MSRRSETTTKVFVGRLPYGVSVLDLRNLFAPYGGIVECDIANKCGFLHMEDPVLANKAIEDLNGTTFNGSRISVERGRINSRGRLGKEGRAPNSGYGNGSDVVNRGYYGGTPGKIHCRGGRTGGGVGGNGRNQRSGPYFIGGGGGRNGNHHKNDVGNFQQSRSNNNNTLYKEIGRYDRFQRGDNTGYNNDSYGTERNLSQPHIYQDERTYFNRYDTGERRLYGGNYNEYFAPQQYCQEPSLVYGDMNTPNVGGGTILNSYERSNSYNNRITQNDRQPSLDTQTTRNGDVYLGSSMSDVLYSRRDHGMNLLTGLSGINSDVYGSQMNNNGYEQQTSFREYYQNNPVSFGNSRVSDNGNSSMTQNYRNYNRQSLDISRNVESEHKNNHIIERASRYDYSYPSQFERQVTRGGGGFASSGGPGPRSDMAPGRRY